MTAIQYVRAYRAARASLSNMTLSMMRKLKRAYLEAAAQAAAKLQAAELAGYGELTTVTWAQLEEALRLGARKVQTYLDAQLPLTMRDIAGDVTHIDETYFVDALNRAGLGLDKIRVRNLFIDASDKVIRSLVNRVYSDGYSFSQRIWRAAEAGQDAMKRVITSGIASGRSTVEVARDLQVYVRTDAATLAKRWGGMSAAEFQKRVGSAGVDYNALRLVRSELYMSIQDAAKTSGDLNPGCTGEFDWIYDGEDCWSGICAELQARGPYSSGNVPDYPHPHCNCYLAPVLRDHDDFIRDLKRFDAGESVGYLEEWYRGAYQRAA